MPNFAKGARAAEQRTEDRKTEFFRVRAVFMKDGEGPWAFRFLTELDEMLTADTHSYCDTKPKPKEYTGTSWPEHMPAICQNDDMFRVADADGNPTDVYEGYPDRDGTYGNCFIHDRDRGKPRGGKFKGDKSTPSNLTYAVAVVREPVPDPVTGRITGYKDAMAEMTLEDGTKRSIPRIVVVPQTWRAFYSGLEASLFDSSAVLGAYDIRVTRKGNDFSFSVSPEDSKLRPGSEPWARYTQALALTGFDLGEHLLEQASPDWYDRWFVPGAVPKGGYSRDDDDEGGQEGAQAGQPAGEVPAEETVLSMRKQLERARQGS